MPQVSRELQLLTTTPGCPFWRNSVVAGSRLRPPLRTRAASVSPSPDRANSFARLSRGSASSRSLARRLSPPRAGSTCTPRNGPPQMAARPLPPPRARFHLERIREVWARVDAENAGSLTLANVKRSLDDQDVDWVRPPRARSRGVTACVCGESRCEPLSARRPVLLLTRVARSVFICRKRFCFSCCA